MQTDSEQQLEGEIALMRRVADGDRRAFEELYDRFSRVLFSAAFAVLNNQEAAEDVLQDVFVRIWERAPLYVSALGKPMTWALALTRNKAIDRLRAVQRRGRLQEHAQREAEIFGHSEDRSSFDLLALGEAGGLVREALGKLTEDQRQAIELAFFSSLTQHEIAALLHEPLGTVKARIRRGMMKLREILGPVL